MPRQITLFAGPTLFGTGLDTSETPEIRWAPPARRGDIAALVAQSSEPGIIGLADGTFHSYPSVGHKELREALSAGWRIYGLCSMGAIRAAEMAHMGMVPWGRVAMLFHENEDFADDEVTLVHGAEEPYVPLSEPLVHMREFLSYAYGQGLLDEQQAQAVLDSLQQRWYGDRTLSALSDALLQVLSTEAIPLEIADLLNNFDAFRLKQADLRAFVADKPWLPTA